MSATAYNGACNPPRRAKRARVERPAANTNDPAPSTSQRRPHLLPKAPISSHGVAQPDSSDEDDEEDYDPGASAPAPKRRGRKPGPLSRSARESQRKLNHSRIEKARRTKINDTLSTLSNLVNDAERKKGAQGSAEEKSEGKKSEKEFKLDVLVKTVAYMQDLIARVKELEGRQCSLCSSGTDTARMPSPSSSSVTGKRKRQAEDPDVIDVDNDAVADNEEYIGDDEKADDDEIEEIPHPRLPPSQRSSVHPSPSPRLPPIASWLPHPYVDPSCIAALTDPNGAGAGVKTPQVTSHLPSPPLSGSFRATAPDSITTLPSLTLPAPAHHPRPGFPNARRLSTASSRTVVASSPTVSPTWTPEDEKHAASMLLQMSTSPSSSSASPRSSSVVVIGKTNRTEVERRGAALAVQTPSSLLGM